MTTLKFHQGDVIGASIENLPDNVRKVSNKPIATGEVSGHVHILTGQVELFEINSRLFAIVGDGGAKLQHTYQANLINHNQYQTTLELPVADHKSILLPQGNYEFWIQKAYNPFSKIFENVVD